MKRAPSMGRGRRSPVMVWMWKNRATLEAGFKETAPAWNVLADYLAEHGITDGLGKAPTARAAREAWARVQSVKAAPIVPEEPSAAPKVRPVIEPAATELSVASDDDEPDPSLMFRVMRRPKKTEE